MKKLTQISFHILLYVGLISFASSSIAAVGGLTYGYVNWPSNPSYYNMDQLIRIDTAPQKNLKQGYFWSYQFSAGQMTGYFGLQQQPDGSRNINAAIWDTSSGVAGTGFTAASFGGEGTGIRIFGPYAWVPGKIYRLRIWKCRKIGGDFLFKIPARVLIHLLDKFKINSIQENYSMAVLHLLSNSLDLILVVVWQQFVQHGFLPLRMEALLQLQKLMVL